MLLVSLQSSIKSTEQNACEEEAQLGYESVLDTSFQ
jgi:hypothetical protein